MDFMHISGQKEAIWKTLSILLSDGGPPNVAKHGKTLPPLSTDLRCRLLVEMLETDGRTSGITEFVNKKTLNDQ